MKRRLLYAAALLITVWWLAHRIMPREPAVCEITQRDKQEICSDLGDDVIELIEEEDLCMMPWVDCRP
ncbi:MAG: hypothetical protein E4G89_03060 [Methanothrix sp.]|nr:MAG: hypothetical protein E4G89_03060 [Methanothrix sp.]